MKFFIVIYGPTGVGKTQLALDLAKDLPIEVINCDLGQFYTPLTIGTAKPDWQNQIVKHHLFDIVNDPVDYSAHDYFKACTNLMENIFDKEKIPVIVGGSGFYLKSLYNQNIYEDNLKQNFSFEQKCKKEKDYLNLQENFICKKDENGLSQNISTCEKNESELFQNSSTSIKGKSDLSQKFSTYIKESVDFSWEELAAIDIDRARAIHPNDKYRINRAIEIWYKMGIKPSLLKPEFKSPSDCLFIYLDREKEELALRVKLRVIEMLKMGWIEEVESLSKDWRPFLFKKGLIGYREIYDLIDKNLNLDFTIDKIGKRSLDYVKRQRIFWRGLKPLLEKEKVLMEELNLTFLDYPLYVKQLSKRVAEICSDKNYNVGGSI